MFHRRHNSLQNKRKLKDVGTFDSFSLKSHPIALLLFQGLLVAFVQGLSLNRTPSQSGGNSGHVD